MAGLSGALAGLSAVGPGYNKGRQDYDKADMADLQLNDAKNAELAKVAFGNALAMLSGGGQGGPQPPMPGQPSQPMQQPGMRPPMPQGMPGGGMPPQMAGGPPPQGPRPMMGGGAPGGGMAVPPGPPQPAAGGMPPQGMPPQGGMGRPQGGMMDWRQVMAAVKQANPNIPPQVAAQAVSQFLPLMNAQSKMEWQQLSLQLREQALQQREQLAHEAESGRNTRSERSDTRMRDAQEQRGQQFQQREHRLENSLQFRQDSTYQRLEQQKQEAERKAQAAQGKQGVAEWRAAVDAQDKHVRQRIQAYSVMNNLKPEERKSMLDEADQFYKQQVEEGRTKFGRSTPGATPPTKAQAAAPKATDKPPAQAAVPGQMKPMTPDIKSQFDAAIAAGKPKDALINRLKEQGYAIEGL